VIVGSADRRDALTLSAGVRIGAEMLMHPASRVREILGPSLRIPICFDSCCRSAGGRRSTLPTQGRQLSNRQGIATIRAAHDSRRDLL